MEHFFHKIHGYFDWPDLYSELAKSLPDNFTFAEIGVWKGRSLSYFVVEAINNKKNFSVYAIDTFKGSEEHQKGQWCYDPITDTENGLYNHFLININPIKEKVTVMRESSLSASKKFLNNSLDCIFIDGAHDYDSVLADLHAWLPKLKENCAIYGDDYDWPGVKKAVDEYAYTNKLKASKVSNKCWKLSR